MKRLLSPFGKPARLLLATLIASAGLTLAIAQPGMRGHHDDRDHERARAAVQSGEILPLPVVLERLQQSHPGQVLGLELDRDDEQWIYKVKLLQSDGQLVKLKLDAKTATVLGIRRRDR